MTRAREDDGDGVGLGAPRRSFIGFEEPLWPGDSGFTVLFDDAPDPDEVRNPTILGSRSCVWTA